MSLLLARRGISLRCRIWLLHLVERGAGLELDWQLQRGSRSKPFDVITRCTILTFKEVFLRDGASGCHMVIAPKQDMFFVLLEQTPSERQHVQRTLEQLVHESLQN
jgi:hypothetical protein